MSFHFPNRVVPVLALAVVLTANPCPAGNEAPWTRHTIENGFADGVELADFNDDGRMDAVSAFYERGEVHLHLQPVPDNIRKPWPSIPIGKVPFVEHAFPVDLDGDGALDVVSAGRESQKLAVSWGPADKSKRSDRTAWETEFFGAVDGKTDWLQVMPMQVDGRYGIDLIIGGRAKQDNQTPPQSTLGWLQAPEDPRQTDGWVYHQIDKVGWTMSILQHDMDGDGDSDVLITDRRGTERSIRWMENPAETQDSEQLVKPWTAHVIGKVRGDEPMFAALGDLNGDGRIDVVCPTVADPKAGRLIWYARNNGQNAWTEHLIKRPEGLQTRAKSVTLADVNQNGQTDILLTTGRYPGDAPGPSMLVWLEYETSPAETTWQRHEISGPPGSKADPVRMSDVDGDGDLDAVTTEQEDKLGVIWYENPASQAEPR